MSSPMKIFIRLFGSLLSATKFFADSKGLNLLFLDRTISKLQKKRSSNNKSDNLTTLSKQRIH